VTHIQVGTLLLESTQEPDVELFFFRSKAMKKKVENIGSHSLGRQVDFFLKVDK
jgi:hypothetical protein